MGARAKHRPAEPMMSLSAPCMLLAGGNKLRSARGFITWRREKWYARNLIRHWMARVRIRFMAAAVPISEADDQSSFRSRPSTAGTPGKNRTPGSIQAGRIACMDVCAVRERWGSGLHQVALPRGGDPKCIHLMGSGLIAAKRAGHCADDRQVHWSN